MSAAESYESLQEFADENRETLVRILKHGNSNFARGCALVALVRSSDKPEIENVIDELEKEVQ